MIEPEVIETALVPGEHRPRLTGHARTKILFVTNTGEFGGLERHVLYMVRSLRRSGVRSSIFNLGPDLFTAHLHPDETAQVSIACKKEPMSFWGWCQLFRDIRPDVVVLCYGWIGAFPFASVAAWLAGIPKRFSIQQLLTPPPPKVEGRSFSVLRRLVGGRTRRLVGWRVSAYFYHRIICVSNAVRKSLVMDYRFPESKTITIYNCVSVSEFYPSEQAGAAVRTRLGVGSDEFLLVCSARLSEIKRIDILLQAMARVLRDGVRCKCVIVGDGPLRERLLEQARHMNLSGHVFFEGFQEDVRPYLQASSAFVLTSRAEGLPLAILEAMACGLPGVVTDVGGNAEAITHNVHGLVVPPGSPEAVAEAISYLVTHPLERAQMSKMARARACEVFDTEKSMAEIRNVILS